MTTIFYTAHSYQADAESAAVMACDCEYTT